MNIYSESPIVLGSPSFLYNNSMNQIDFRLATPDDAEALLAIYKPYVEKTAITFEYDVRDFLKENDNFCLIIYVFNKLDSLIFLKNSEETHEILVSSLYMNEYSTFKECVNFLINKFSNYKIIIDSTFKDKNFINVVKKNGGVLKNNRYIIQL